MTVIINLLRKWIYIVLIFVVLIDNSIKIICFSSVSKIVEFVVVNGPFIAVIIVSFVVR